jgi:hypothetical protein
MIKLLTTENAKTIKGETQGYKTAIIYMIPDAKLCPFSKIAGCAISCLVNSGNARFENVNSGRAKRTRYFYENQSMFMEQLFAEIKLFEIQAKKEGFIPVIRLNGTSDISYEEIPVLGYNNIFEAFPQIQFYDYTKIVNRLTKTLPANYDLTFSYSAENDYQPYVQHAISLNARISVVFHTKKLPDTFLGLPVIDGDKHDLRFQEPPNTIVGLKFKRPTNKKVDMTTLTWIVQ